MIGPRSTATELAYICNDSAAKVLFVHNHPSGNPEPSPQDRRLTDRLCEAGRLVGIPVLDHLVVGDETYFSFAERGLLGRPATDRAQPPPAEDVAVRTRPLAARSSQKKRRKSSSGTETHPASGSQSVRRPPGVRQQPVRERPPAC